MTVTLTYGPEEVAAARRALATDAVYAVLIDIDEWLRRLLKYNELTEEQSKCYLAAREELYRLLGEYNVDIHDVE
jgi:hypothetical protein